MRYRTSVPWWAKIAAKMVLSRLPFGYGIWQRLGLFRHGQMDQASYLRDVFDGHVHRAGFDSAGLRGKTILELGPGDSVGTALLAATFGAKCILADAGKFADRDVAMYRRLAEELKHDGLTPPDLSKALTLEQVLAACSAQYYYGGLDDLRRIESGSVDLIFSQAVLEHVRRDEFLATMRECHRLLSPHGVASHRVDLKDHLGGGLDNLRFSDRWWESALFSNSGFYTNRIRYSEMLDLFRESGFKVNVLSVDRWSALPLDRRRMFDRFSALPMEDLQVKGFDVLLYPHSEGG